MLEYSTGVVLLTDAWVLDNTRLTSPDGRREEQRVDFSAAGHAALGYIIVAI